MRISDWSSDGCSSELPTGSVRRLATDRGAVETSNLWKARLSSIAPRNEQTVGGLNRPNANLDQHVTPVHLWHRYVCQDKYFQRLTCLFEYQRLHYTTPFKNFSGGISNDGNCHTISRNRREIVQAILFAPKKPYPTVSL